MRGPPQLASASPSAVLTVPAFLPVSGLLGFVRFYTSDVVWRAFHQGAHEVVGLFLERKSNIGQKHGTFSQAD